MFKNERTDKIMEILKENKYTTVEKLVSELHYSPATIRRDLTYLAEIGLVRKSYGGVCIEENAKPLIVREHEMHDEKIKICKMAADLINDGDFIGLIGHTGSGKSTIVQHLNGLLKASKGDILFNGQDIYDKDFSLKELRSKVGLVFQYPEHQLFETTVFEDVCF